jgi:hypothetical protein
VRKKRKDIHRPLRLCRRSPAQCDLTRRARNRALIRGQLGKVRVWWELVGVIARAFRSGSPREAPRKSGERQLSPVAVLRTGAKSTRDASRSHFQLGRQSAVLSKVAAPCSRTRQDLLVKGTARSSSMWTSYCIARLLFLAALCETSINKRTFQDTRQVV